MTKCNMFHLYRNFNMKPYASFEDMVGPDHPELTAELKRLYGDDVEAMEYAPGIYLEKKAGGGMVGGTFVEMGAPASVTGKR